MTKTPAVGRIESAREKEQARLDGAKSQTERNKVGQFATPPSLARAIVKASLEFMPPGERVRFLDPGIGTGAFYSALRTILSKRRVQSALGFEMDKEVASVARELWAEDGLEVRIGDFTEARPSGNSALPNLIIANPPYVRHHHLSGETKQRLQQQVVARLGLSTSGLTGLYCYFMLLSDLWMDQAGVAAWLIPSEFFDVNYGRVLREYLARHVSLLRVHRFDASDVQFDDALVSSVVVFFKKLTPADKHKVIFTEGPDLSSPRRVRRLRSKDLSNASRWSPLVNGLKTNDAYEVRLGELFKIKRGIATGANKFFILPRARARELHLPDQFLVPILPSPRHLKATTIEAAPDGFPMLDEQLVLIDCSLDESTLEREHPTLYRYFQNGTSGGLNARYLASTRQPWYSQEQRPAAPFLCTYMGRSVGKEKPFRFIWNKSRATAANVYLLLYPTAELKTLLEEQPLKTRVVFDFLNGIDAGSLRAGGRVYGGGLYKVEPRELAAFPAQSLLRALGMTHARIRQLPLFGVADRRRKPLAGAP